MGLPKHKWLNVEALFQARQLPVRRSLLEILICVSLSVSVSVIFGWSQRSHASFNHCKVRRENEKAVLEDIDRRDTGWCSNACNKYLRYHVWFFWTYSKPSQTKNFIYFRGHGRFKVLLVDLKKCQRSSAVLDVPPEARGTPSLLVSTSNWSFSTRTWRSKGLDGWGSKTRSRKLVRSWHACLQMRLIRKNVADDATRESKVHALQWF